MSGDEEVPEDWQLVRHRTRRGKAALPRRYRDICPDPPAALPPSQLRTTNPASEVPSSRSAAGAREATHTGSHLRKILQSACNIFGLFREYHATHFPSHDPDGDITKESLCADSNEDIATADPMSVSGVTHSTPPSFFPYPTYNSLLLGDWYWNGKINKSSSDFMDLIKIVGHPEFRPEDVAGTNWRKINAQLGQDLADVSVDTEASWVDELAPGWTDRPVIIDVPFHQRARATGSVRYEAGTLRYRKLVSVIREKIVNSFQYLHLEPYKLYWRSDPKADAVRVFGELYSSDAFIDAHEKLQDSPPEPGCNLPRVIIGLMLGSDGTHLTDFSNAYLSPVYLAFGNESVRRRTSPKCAAFEHVAYFDKVRDTLRTFRIMELHFLNT